MIEIIQIEILIKKKNSFRCGGLQDHKYTRHISIYIISFVKPRISSTEMHIQASGGAASSYDALLSCSSNSIVNGTYMCSRARPGPSAASD